MSRTHEVIGVHGEGWGPFEWFLFLAFCVAMLGGLVKLLGSPSNARHTCEWATCTSPAVYVVEKGSERIRVCMTHYPDAIAAGYR